jgi:hypothetical protein
MFTQSFLFYTFTYISREGNRPRRWRGESRKNCHIRLQRAPFSKSGSISGSGSKWQMQSAPGPVSDPDPDLDIDPDVGKPALLIQNELRLLFGPASGK